MENRDDSRFVAAMEATAIATRSEINDADYAVYRQAFARMPIDLFEQAMKTCWMLPRFPTVGQVIESAGISNESKLQNAWAQLHEALRSFGRFDLITFADGVLAATIENMGGLLAIAQMEPSQLNSFGWHRFKEAYLALLQTCCDHVKRTFSTQCRIPVIDGVPLRQPRIKTIGGDALLIASGNTPEILEGIEVKRP